MEKLKKEPTILPRKYAMVLAAVSVAFVSTGIPESKAGDEAQVRSSAAVLEVAQERPSYPLDTSKFEFTDIMAKRCSRYVKEALADRKHSTTVKAGLACVEITLDAAA